MDKFENIYVFYCVLISFALILVTQDVVVRIQNLMETSKEVTRGVDVHHVAVKFLCHVGLNCWFIFSNFSFLFFRQLKGKQK